MTWREVEIQRAVCTTVHGYGSEVHFPVSQVHKECLAIDALNVWCHSREGGGRRPVLRSQQSFTSWIPLRNPGLRVGDRTMEWAIYGQLLTTSAFRPHTANRCFTNLPPTLTPLFISTNFQGFHFYPRLRVKKMKPRSRWQHQITSFILYFPVWFYICLSSRKSKSWGETLGPWQLIGEHFLYYDRSPAKPLFSGFFPW